MMRRIALVPGIVAIVTVLGFSAGPAMAKPGSPSPTPASLVVSTTSGGSTAAPAYGGSVGMTATFSSMKEVPEVSLNCTSNGVNVYSNGQEGSGGTSPWNLGFALWSQTWQDAGGGPASCVAQLYYFTWQGKSETGVVYLASTTFTAAG